MNAIASLSPPPQSSFAEGNDDFQLPKAKKQPAKSVRVYIGNLPQNVEGLESLLVQVLNDKAGLASISEGDISVNNNNNSCHAFVSCPSNQDADKVIASLHRQEFYHQKLTVQRERKPKRAPNNNFNGNFKGGKPKKKGHQEPESTFGKKSWSKAPPPGNKKKTPPTPTQAQPQSQPVKVDAPISQENDPAADFMSQLITNEMQTACATGDKDDALNTALASLAAVSMLAPAMEADTNNNVEAAQNTSSDDPLQVARENEDDKVTTLEDFKSRCQKPLSELLNGYGEEDPEWQAFQPIDLAAPTTTTEENTDTTHHPETNESQDDSAESTESRLGRQGKAPIHVEFVSFGYSHGAPAAIRNGWSHAQPLPAFECRDLPTVPGHLMWRDGCSGFVQRTLMAEPDVQAMATSVGEQTFAALKEAIAEGGHGYVSPLQMKVYVGSENGRHRSVVVCENAAKTLRKYLRKNEKNCITAPTSVSTAHRDVERAKKKGREERNARNKKEELESDW